MIQSTMSEEKSRLVYSTDKVIPRKDDPAGKTAQTRILPSQQRLAVRLERKGRGGKSVTLIEGLQMSQKDRESFLNQLKTRLGTGGALKNEVLELQGDHRNAVVEVLQSKGHKPKLSGG